MTRSPVQCEFGEFLLDHLVVKKKRTKYIKPAKLPSLQVSKAYSTIDEADRRDSFSSANKLDEPKLIDRKPIAKTFYNK